MKRGLLIAAALAAFLLFLVARMPAGQVARRLPAGIELTGVSGTLWSGEASTLTVHGHPLGALGWSCRPWRLLLGRWSCAVTLTPDGGAASADLSGTFSGAVAARNLRGRLPIALFEGVATPRGWTGALELDIADLRFEQRRPAAATGLLLLRGLRPPGAGGQPLGDFELVVGEGRVGSEALTGRLRDLGGPLHVRGAVELRDDGGYLLTGEAAPGPDAGPAIFDTLGFLGPPDAQGRRPFTIEGTL